jgi:NADPH-dependent glutamate synthase beta subunit-like oxidoreductase
MAGGMMRFGIPKYRLPRDVDGEVARIVAMGVRLELGRKVSNILSTMKEGKTTPPSSRSARTSPADPGRHRDARSMPSVLRSMEARRSPCSGRGRRHGSATRLRRRAHGEAAGCERSHHRYRRTRAKMPAHDWEVEEALQEGVLIKWSTIRNVADEGTLTVERWRSTRRDFPADGRDGTLEADSLVLALGQRSTCRCSMVPGSRSRTARSRSERT